MSSTLKRLALISFFIGVGLAVGAALSIWGYTAYQDYRANQWEQNKVVGQFATFETGMNEQNRPVTLIFTYNLENRTDKDYRINSRESVKLFSIDSGGALQSTGWDSWLDFPLFIPAGSTIQISLWSDYKYGDVFDYTAINDGPEPQKSFARLVNTKRPMLSGFVAFDEENRYRIEMPKGW